MSLRAFYLFRDFTLRLISLNVECYVARKTNFLSLSLSLSFPLSLYLYFFSLKLSTMLMWFLALEKKQD